MSPPRPGLLCLRHAALALLPAADPNPAGTRAALTYETLPVTRVFHPETQRQAGTVAVAAGSIRRTFSGGRTHTAELGPSEWSGVLTRGIKLQQRFQVSGGNRRALWVMVTREMVSLAVQSGGQETQLEL